MSFSSACGFKGLKELTGHEKRKCAECDRFITYHIFAAQTNGYELRPFCKCGKKYTEVYRTESDRAISNISNAVQEIDLSNERAEKAKKK